MEPLHLFCGRNRGDPSAGGKHRQHEGDLFGRTSTLWGHAVDATEGEAGSRGVAGPCQAVQVRDSPVTGQVTADCGCSPSCQGSWGTIPDSSEGAATPEPRIPSIKTIINRWDLDSSGAEQLRGGAWVGGVKHGSNTGAGEEGRRRRGNPFPTVDTQHL